MVSATLLDIWNFPSGMFGVWSLSIVNITAHSKWQSAAAGIG